MFYRLFVFIAILAIELHAMPSLAEAAAAVKQNPALLETPQAKAAMKEKGITVEEVKRRLKEGEGEGENSLESTNEAENDIEDSSVDESELDAEEIEDTEEFLKDDGLIKKVNPFAFKSNQVIAKELSTKQQKFTTNKLTRYSASFYSNKNQIDSSSLPTPDDYIVSTGDFINLHVYGDRDQDYILEIKNNGTVDLAYIGPVKIGGMKFIDAKKHLKSRLKKHYKMSSFNVNIDKYSTIQVTLIGEVKNPGIYNLSSFSTVKDLLLASKGIQENGSIRDILIKRNSKILARLDFYDLLFKGENLNTILLKQGDVVIVKKAEKLISIDGYVNNTAIFELNKTEKLDKLIEYAGGMRPDASNVNIKIDRFSDNSIIETFNVSYKDAASFEVQDRDRVYIYPLDFMANSSVNLYGSVIRPGNYRLNNTKTLNKLFSNLLIDGVKKFFLPQTYFEYGVIKRYSEDLNYETVSFNLTKVLDGSEIVKLKPQDRIFIFSITDIFSNSYVTTKGDVLTKSGKLQFYPGMTIEDAVNASGISGVIDDKVRLTTFNTDNFMPKTVFYSSTELGNVKLSAYDEIEVYDYYERNLLEPITISGEVVSPTSVYYEKDMRLANLLEIAGGFTRKAYKNKLEIVRYYIDDEQKRQKEIINFDVRKMNLEDIVLMPYDEVTIFKIPKWSDKKTVTLKGQIQFPGTYIINDGERLSDVLKRAGGFTKDAFVSGSVFTRDSIRKNQADQYNKSLARVKRQLAIFNAMPANSKNANTAQAGAALNEVMQEAKKYEPIGRISVKIDEDLEKLEDSKFNLVLQNLDTITIPSIMDTVTVFGEVFNPTSFVYDDQRDSIDYIELASGYSRAADTERVYIIHADGTSEPIDSGWFNAGVKIQKGDTIVVPIYIKEYDNIQLWDSVAKILSSFALTAAAVNSLGVF